ncbi:MAG: hypothetical protein HY043_02490 [Verrucomicrobia bacterium]|nr:hypothetical protein [Verrucomicrobiota bacterium]
MTGPDATVRLTNFFPGSWVNVQLRIWEISKGSTFEQAEAVNAAFTQSEVIFTATGGYGLGPPVVPNFGTLAIGTLVKARPGLSLFGNPTIAQHTVAEVFQTPKNGTVVYLFDNLTQTYDVNVFDFGEWGEPNQVVLPGQGGFVFNPSSESLDVIFVGTNRGGLGFSRSTGKSVFYLVTCSSRSGCLAEFFTDRSRGSMFPGSTSLQTGDMAYRFYNNRWYISKFENGFWQDGGPYLEAGEAMFLHLVPRP